MQNNETELNKAQTDARHAACWRQVIKASDKAFYTHAKDDAMKGAGILPNMPEVLVVDPLAQLQDGSIALFKHQGEIIMRRHFYRNGKIELRSENAFYETLYPDEAELEFLGVVVNAIRRF